MFIPLLASSIIFEPSKSSPKSEYSPAIEKAINFFDDSHDPYALLFLDVIYRRFGVLEFKDSSQRFDQELPNNPLIEPTMKVFRRIADNTNQPSSSDFYEAKQQGETNLIVIPALYCDRLGLPSNYPQMLEEATKKGEYYLTHVLLALIWVTENGYGEEIPQDFVEYVYDANTKLINSDDEVYDIELEAAAFLCLAGQSERIKESFVESVIANQNDDGSWKSPDNIEKWHSTVLGLILLMHIQYPSNSYPSMLA
ncbi:MAG: hypothetical protein P8Y79_11550 [Ignavibacteriaceae bacterium]